MTTSIPGELRWMALALGAASFLVWRWVEPLPIPALAEVAPPVPLPAETPLALSALELALGFQRSDSAAATTDLVLKASFVASDGRAHALVASGGSEGIYRVGDRLPQGSVLRRIEAGSIVVWGDGREHTLALNGGNSPVFLPSASARAVPAPSTRLLREVQ